MYFMLEVRQKCLGKNAWGRLTIIRLNLKWWWQSKSWGRLTIIALKRNTFKKEKLNVSNILIIDDEEKVINLAVFKLCKA
jgi:hypothetical protein